MQVFPQGHELPVYELQTYLKSSFWGPLPQEVIGQIIEKSECSSLNPGDPLVLGGEIPTKAIFVLSGQVRVLNEVNETVSILESNTGFGLWHGLIAEKCSYTLRISTRAQILVFPISNLKTVVRSVPEIERQCHSYGAKFVKGYAALRQVRVKGLNPNSIRDLERSSSLSRFQISNLDKLPVSSLPWGLITSGILKLFFDGCLIHCIKPGKLFSSQLPGGVEAIAEGEVHGFYASTDDLRSATVDTPALKQFLLLGPSFNLNPIHEIQSPKISTASERTIQLRQPIWKRMFNRFPTVLQLDENDCGPSCLTSILHFHGQEIPRSQVRRMFKAGLIGVSFAELAQVAESYGFIPKALATSYDRLPNLEMPVIAHYKTLHFVVVYNVSPTTCLIGDPAKGLRRLPRSEFEQLWSGKVLALRPTIRLREITFDKSGFFSKIKQLSGFARGYQKTLIEILLASCAIQIFNFAPALFSQVLFDRILPNGSSSTLNILAVGMVLLYGLQACISFTRSYLLGYVSRGIDLVMSSEFHEHLLALPISYFQTRSSGDILKRFYDNQKMRRLFTDQFIPLVLDFLTAVLSFVLIIQYNWQMVVIVLFIMGLYLAIVFGSSSKMKTSWQKASEAEGEVNSLIFESISSITIIKSLAAEYPVTNRLYEALEKALENSFRRETTGNWVNSFGMLTFNYVNLFLFWFGIHQVFIGNLTPGAMMALLALCSNLISPINRMAGNWMMVQESMLIIERLFEVIEEKPEVPLSVAKMALPTPKLQGAIEFDNVSFSYPGRHDKNALQNISLSVPANTTVALVGRSGAGKTTIANLLLRFYQPTSGRILIDGLDLTSLSLPELRKQIGVVSQDVVLFRGSIRDNIAFANPEASIEQVIEAAKLAGIHEFILSLPGGYDAKVGERGQSLSGGQKQRISIARAILGKPRILIFDEATSSLDNESEVQIQKALVNLLGKCTSFLIAHRLSTVRNADKIIVLDKGLILEQGTHDDLMTLGGLYHHLYSLG